MAILLCIHILCAIVAARHSRKTFLGAPLGFLLGILLGPLGLHLALISS